MALRPSVVFDLGGVLVSVDFMRACGLPAAQFVDAAKLRRDLERFGVL
ncbi:MAG: hypothetical protein ABIH03_06385 [Pseudomonadota bacterium]